MLPLITELFALFGPIAVKIYRQYADAHDGAAMTDEQMVAEFAKNIDAILAEGAAWEAAHSKKV